MSPGRDELPHRTGKGCEFVDNSPAAKQSACRGQRFALPTAHPFAHKLHSPQSIFIFFEEQNIQEQTYKGERGGVVLNGSWPLNPHPNLS